MKKILLSLLVVASATIANAQMTTEKVFVGKGNVTVSTASVDTPSDTIKFKMNNMKNGELVIPALSYGAKTIPSFTISGASFTMDVTTMTATFADQTFTATCADGKTITGSSLTGKYMLSTSTLDLTLKFTYGAMPFETTYTVSAYYVKPYTDKITVCIGGMAEYTYSNESVTYNVRKYTDGDVKKADVEIPTYTLANTVMGDLTIGGYTVTCLTYNEANDCYYRDYAGDGLTMHFKAVSNGVATMDKDYTLATVGGENITVNYDDENNIEIVNSFKPGAMPYSIVSTFPGSTSGIEEIENGKLEIENSAVYNLAGQRVGADAKGIVIINGKKYMR